VEVECCPDTDQDWSADPPNMSGHPTFLLGIAQPNPDYVGLGRLNRLDYQSVFFV
jgi:hypothetical protein